MYLDDLWDLYGCKLEASIRLNWNYASNEIEKYSSVFKAVGMTRRISMITELSWAC